MPGSCPPSVSVVTVIMRHGVCRRSASPEDGSELYRRSGRPRGSRTDRRPRAEGAERRLQPGHPVSSSSRTRRRGAASPSCARARVRRRRLEPWISQAPVHVVVALREEVYHERYRKPDKLHEDGSEIDWRVPWWWVDAGKCDDAAPARRDRRGACLGVFGLPGKWDGLRGLLGVRRRRGARARSLTIGKQGPATTRAGLGRSAAGSRSRTSSAGSVGSTDGSRPPRGAGSATRSTSTAPSRLLRERLDAYLEDRRDAPLVLVGEAAGYRGARISGSLSPPSGS